jgi:Ni,Fe-hydrogenase maturation factor
MHRIKKILVFGNPLVRKDSLPPSLISDLQKMFPKIEFKEFDAVEDLQKEGRNLYILDAVEGIKRVELITNIDIFEVNKIFSVHDFDLAYTLKLLKNANMIDRVAIIGVPIGMSKEEALEQIKELLNSILSSKSG